MASRKQVLKFIERNFGPVKHLSRKQIRQIKPFLKDALNNEKLLQRALEKDADTDCKAYQV